MRYRQAAQFDDLLLVHTRADDVRMHTDAPDGAQAMTAAGSTTEALGDRVVRNRDRPVLLPRLRAGV